MNADDALSILAEMTCSLDTGATAEWSLTTGTLDGDVGDLNSAVDSGIVYTVRLCLSLQRVCEFMLVSFHAAKTSLKHIESTVFGGIQNQFLVRLEIKIFFCEHWSFAEPAFYYSINFNHVRAPTYSLGLTGPFVAIDISVCVQGSC